MMTTINYEFPIICLSETWLGANNCHLANIPSYNQEYSIRNSRIGGSVSIFIHSNISNYSVRCDISIVNSHIESIFIEIDQSFISADRGLDLCPESSRWTCRCPQHIQPRKEKDLEEDASFHRPAPVMSEDED
ncbi:hypothetical protein CAPTEDRAFT_208758 [Capitella teleta]|uniref:Uncharacterized protein n=1 Tax=Capitella teleta TaxID=283909 RepID=R7TRB3_CAPTE|nr:hypothetical protein CAPTEDRAFT_208758 [Capitella teleta]|eukprot:ELT96117.1 hypothetical protein CAPTEDRAFT_208758 [Capitella teleta]